MTATSSLHKELRQLREELQELAPKEEWSEDFKEKIKLDFTYFSNLVEGNSVSYGAAMELLNGKSVAAGAALKDIIDLQNHHKVLETFFDCYESEDISEALLKGFHKEMMADPLQWKSNDIYNNIGDYRDDRAGTRTPDGTKEYLAPYHIRPAMRDFITELGSRIEQLDEKSPATHPVKLATWAHLKFLGEIHPFKDGNGRVGRIVLAMILMKSGYPPFIPKDKDEYLNAVYQSSLEEPDKLELFIATTLRDLMTKQLANIKA